MYIICILCKQACICYIHASCNVCSHFSSFHRNCFQFLLEAGVFRKKIFLNPICIVLESNTFVHFVIQMHSHSMDARAWNLPCFHKLVFLLFGASCPLLRVEGLYMNMCVCACVCMHTELCNISSIHGGVRIWWGATRRHRKNNATTVSDLCGCRWDQGGKGWSTTNGLEHMYLSGLWSVAYGFFALLLYGASSQGRE